MAIGSELIGVAMEVITAVVAALGSTAIKAFVKGQTPSREDWASATSGVLSAILSQQAVANQALTRIEHKIDQLAIAEYQRPLMAGLRFFEEAHPNWRTSTERDSLLAEARSRFVDAVAAAPDDHHRAIAEWHLAISWLLSGSLRDCLTELTRARDHAFASLVAARQEVVGLSPLDAEQRLLQSGSPMQRLRLEWFTARDPWNNPRLVQPLEELRRERLPAVQAAQQLTAGVQATRETLGVPPHSCGIPRLSPKFPELLHTQIRVGLQHGLNDVFGFMLGVHDIRVVDAEQLAGVVVPGTDRTSPPKAFVIDADITVSVPSAVVATSQPLWFGGPSAMTKNDLEGLALPPLPGAELHPLNVRIGESTRGWIRSGKFLQRPEFLCFYLWPRENWENAYRENWENDFADPAIAALYPLTPLSGLKLLWL